VRRAGVTLPGLPDLQLQDWADLGTVAAAVVSTALVFLALRQLGALRRQIEQGQGALEASQRSADAARQSADAAELTIRESMRARADQEAPRVVVLMEAPEWPPFIDSSRNSMPYANEARLLERLGQATLVGDEPIGDTFVFDEQASWFMWFRTRGVLINEGRGTARVQVDGESRFIKSSSGLYLAGTVELPIPPRVGAVANREYLLRSGEAAVFEWAYGHKLADWADAYTNPTPPNPHGAGFVTITSFDYFEHGVIDFVFAEFSGRPIEPVPGRLGNWRLVQDPEVSMGLTVYPSHRVYRLEGHNLPDPDWLATYSAWNERHRSG